MKKRTLYMAIIWRGVHARKTRLYKGTRCQELVCPDLTWGSPWVGAFTFRVTTRGQTNFRHRAQKPRHARRLGIA